MSEEARRSVPMAFSPWGAQSTACSLYTVRVYGAPSKMVCTELPAYLNCSDAQGRSIISSVQRCQEHLYVSNTQG